MEKTAAEFLSFFTSNVLAFSATLYLPLSNLCCHFPYHKYLAITHVNTRNGYKKRKHDQSSTVSDRDIMDRVITQTVGRLIETLRQTIAFLLRLQNHG